MIKIIKNMLYKTKAQATTELAIMGTIILFVFAILLRYCQIFDMQQWAQMYAFRRAFSEAKERLGAGAYGQVTVVATPEVYTASPAGIERIPSTTQGTGSVGIHYLKDVWQNFDGDPQRDDANRVGITYYQTGNRMINDDKALVMPMMLVERTTASGRVDKYTDLSHLSAMSKDSLVYDADVDPSDVKLYITYEAAPVDTVLQNVTTSVFNEYSAKEDPSRTQYDEKSQVVHNQRFHYKFQRDEFKIIRDAYEDGRENSLTRVLDIPDDVVIELDKTIESSRDWETDK